MKKLKVVLSLLLCVLLVSAAACGEKTNEGAAPQSVVINNTQTTVKPGSFDIDATILPAGADQRYNVSVIGAPNGVTVSGKTVTVAETTEDKLEFTVKAVSLLDLTVSATKKFTVDNPPAPAQEIRTAEEFSAIRNDLNGNYILMNDIDLGGKPWEPIGTADMEDNSGHIVSVGVGFAGRLNGNGYTVKNFLYDNGDGEVVGLFGQIEKTGIVEKMGLQGTLTASKWSGGMVGINHGTIRNCFIDVTVTGTSFPMSAVAGNNKGLVQNTLAVGKVTCPDGKDGAAFVGSTDGQVEHSFAHLGNIPYAYGWGKTSDLSVSKTENQLKSAETYSSWDPEIWYIANGMYPLLRYEGFVPPAAEVLVTVNNTEKSLNLRAEPAENSLQIDYTVANAEDDSVTFSLKESVAGVSVSGTGLLEISSSVADNTRVTVVITSVQDPSKFAEYTVKINNFDPNSAITISSYQDMLTYLVNTDDATDLTKNYALSADIDLSDVFWSGMIGAGTEGDGAFTGTFDGRGHTLKNVAGGNAAANFGLFKKIGEGGEVKNLAIEIRAERMYVGNDSAVLASVNDGLIENVMVSGEIMGTNANVAGFVCLNNGTIRNSVSFVKVLQSESTEPAGVNAVAKTNDGTIENVFVDKEVTGASHLLSAADAALDAYCLASAEMKSAATYADFDQTIWTIAEGQYPALKTL